MKIDTGQVLLVEDNENDLELAMHALGKSLLPGQVDVARDGEEALDYLYRRGTFSSRPPGNPSVILLDINLPKVSGIEVLREMRSVPALRLTPVVMLTSSKEDRDVFESYELGVNAYVVKPLDFAEFAKAVTSLGLFWAIVNHPPTRAAGKS